MKKIFATFLIFIFSFSSTFANVSDYVKISEEIKNSGTASINTIDSILSALSRQELEKIYEKLSTRWDYSLELKYMKLKIENILGKNLVYKKYENITPEEKELGFAFDINLNKWYSLDPNIISSSGNIYFEHEEVLKILDNKKRKGYYFDYENLTWKFKASNSIKIMGYDRRENNIFRELRKGEVLVGKNIKNQKDLEEMKKFGFGYDEIRKKWVSQNKNTLNSNGSRYFTDDEVWQYFKTKQNNGYKWNIFTQNWELKNNNSKIKYSSENGEKIFSNKYFSFKYDLNTLNTYEISDKEVDIINYDKSGIIKILYNSRNSEISFDKEIELLGEFVGNFKKKKIFFQGREAYVLEYELEEYKILQTIILSKDKKNYYMITRTDNNYKDLKDVYNSLKLLK